MILQLGDTALGSVGVARAALLGAHSRWGRGHVSAARTHAPHSVLGNASAPSKRPGAMRKDPGDVRRALLGALNIIPISNQSNQ